MSGISPVIRQLIVEGRRKNPIVEAWFNQNISAWVEVPESFTSAKDFDSWLSGLKFGQRRGDIEYVQIHSSLASDHLIQYEASWWLIFYAVQGYKDSHVVDVAAFATRGPSGTSLLQIPRKELDRIVIGRLCEPRGDLTRGLALRHAYDTHEFPLSDFPSKDYADGIYAIWQPSKHSEIDEYIKTGPQTFRLI